VAKSSEGGRPWPSCALATCCRPVSVPRRASPVTATRAAAAVGDPAWPAGMAVRWSRIATPSPMPRASAGCHPLGPFCWGA